MVQEDAGIEVVAVDDGSTDDTVEILKSYVNRLNLEVIEQGRVANWVSGTIRGLAAASAPLASILHQDDLWLPGRLRVARERLRGRMDVLLAHPVWFVDERGRKVGRWRCPLPARRLLDPDTVVERLLVQNFMSLPGTVFPRAIALEGGGLDERLWYTADWDLWLRVSGRIPTLYVPETLGAVRVHASSITATETSRLDEFRWQHEEVLSRHLDSWSASEARRMRVRALAEFSIDVNTTLAAKANGSDASIGSLVAHAFRLGPWRWGTYVRHSRIHERAASRLRAGLGRPKKE